ncbi:MAG: AarF/ABC1/UbiB kinase family protein [bacterium]|nr:AarF/ABC1/UbiB kinase family protein [bacterium]
MAKKDSSISELLPTQLIHPSERPPVPSAKKHFKRFRFIYVLFQLGRLFLGNAILRVMGRKSAPLREERVIKCLQRLGMIWIRVAQAFSLRGSQLSDSFGLRLMDLRDKGGAHPFQRIRGIIETELEHPLEEIFDHFEETPFAATTVSQLHRARLRKEQVWTAVKVQQPLTEDIFQRDLVLFRRLTGLMKLFHIGKGMRWNELYHELEEIKIRELNYYYEAAALDTLEQNLSGQQVHVPNVFRRYCRKRVLVMEFIQGALLSDLIAMREQDPERLDAWLEKNNIEPQKVARRLFHSMYRQVFEQNFFHGDMNTGTIILLRNSHMAVIECRSAGSLDKESLEKQRMFLRSLAEGELVTAAEIYFLLASRLPRVDLNTVKERLLRIWRVWETRTHIKKLPYEQKSLAFMTGRVNRVVQDSHFAPLWSFTKLTGTWVHLDNALAALWPGLNYLKELRLYFRRAEQRDQVSKLRRMPSRIASSIAALREVPKRTAEYSLFKETMIRRQAQVVQGSSSKLNAVISAGFGFLAFFSFVIGGLLLTAFSIRHLEMDLEPFLGPQLSWLMDHVPDMSLLVWLVILVVFAGLFVSFRAQKKHFNSQEYGQNGNGAAFDT